MGLDMYLKAEKYVSGWDHVGGDERAEYVQLADSFGVKDYIAPGSPSALVTFTVAYWRKANQIHSWFVREVQNGEDECRPHNVSRAQLNDLVLLCRQVLESRDPAPLEPAAGFFFGSTEIGDYYWGDLQDTITQLERVLKMPDSFGFIYQSSW